MRRRVTLLIITVVVIVGVFAATLVSSNRPVLGLDLQGGISIVLFPVKGTDLSALNTAVDVIRNRIDGLGIAEPDVQRQGNTIVVNLPGVKDRSKAELLVGQTAELRFRAVQQQLPWAAQPAASTTTVKGATTTTAKSATTTTRTGTTVKGATTSSSPSIAPGGSQSNTSTSGHADARTIDTAPIVARFHAAATTTVAPTTAAPATTAGTATTAATATSAAPGKGVTTTTAAGATTTTAPAQAFPGCAKLIAQSPKDTDSAKQVILPDRNKQFCYVLGPLLLTGKSIGSTSTVYDSNVSEWATNVHFKNNDFVNKIAVPYLNKIVAIELDGVVQSAPKINSGITGKDVEITGGFSQGQASSLSLVLRYGSLPVQFDQHKQTIESVSPTLGKDQLTAGLVSGLIGLGLVAIYMILYYRLLGLVVVVGLGLTGMLFYSVVSYLSSSHGLTLTLAGVTGIIVSVGVTVDSYVVYFERLKDEVRSGRTVRSSLEVGFTRSFRTIIAADLVSLIGAGVLYVFATSSVKGFALFLGISTAMDLLLAYCFMHPMVSVLARRPALVKLPAVGIASALDVPGAVA